MTRHEYFIKRLKEMGAFDKDAAYGGMIGKAIEKLSLCFEGQGHSGFSAGITNQLWGQLMKEWGDGTAFKTKE